MSPSRINAACATPENARDFVHRSLTRRCWSAFTSVFCLPPLAIGFRPRRLVIRAQSESERQIARRTVARAAVDHLPLLPPDASRDHRADSVAIALRALQLRFAASGCGCRRRCGKEMPGRCWSRSERPDRRRGRNRRTRRRAPPADLEIAPVSPGSNFRCPGCGTAAAIPRIELWAGRARSVLRYGRWRRKCPG